MSLHSYNDICPNCNARVHMQISDSVVFNIDGQHISLYCPFCNQELLKHERYRVKELRKKGYKELHFLW